MVVRLCGPTMNRAIFPGCDLAFAPAPPPPTTLSTGEAVIENGWMDQRCRYMPLHSGPLKYNTQKHDILY